MSASAPNIICFSTYFKGAAFIQTCKEAGCTVYLLTHEALKEKPWPWESIDETFYIPGDRLKWDMNVVKLGLAHLMRDKKIDRLVALDDFDVEKAAALREEFRLPGMGQTTARYFRDKLAMRQKAEDEGIAVPAFTAVFNNAAVEAFLENNPGPWVMKPRSSASAIGIKKLTEASQVWDVLEKLGDERHEYVLEMFVPGEVFHVDGIIEEGKILFQRVHKYMLPPMEVAHEGRVFRTHTVAYNSAEEKQMLQLNKDLMKAFKHKRGVFHSEFIKNKKGKAFFLETSARVGGANIVDLLEASSGINLWREWAKLETTDNYKLPKPDKLYAGLIISLAKQEKPDTSAYADEEISWRLNLKQHAGLIVKSKKRERVVELLDSYAKRFYNDFFATQPIADKPTE